MTADVSPSPLARYREHLRAGHLAYQFDAISGAAVFPPRLVAPGSGSAHLEWRVSTGTGTVYATTHIQGRDQPAYNVALIDMDEGFRLMGRVEQLDAAQVRIGQRVKVRIHPGAGEEPPYPVFDPMGDA